MRQSVRQLNLMQLAVFEALCTHGTTYKAAEYLNISQPGISQYLKKLRYLMDDELLIRTSEGLEPTELGHRLLEEVRNVLDQTDNILKISSKEFDPNNENKLFTVSGNSFSAEFLFNIFSKKFQRKHPLIKVDSPLLDISVAVRAMEERRLDLYLGNIFSVLPEHYRIKTLRDAPFQVLCSSKNKNFKTGKISKKDFINMPHIKVPTDTAPSVIDRLLLDKKSLQKNVSSVPYHRIAVEMVLESDHLLMVDPFMIRSYLKNKNLRLLEPDFDIPKSKIDLVWHRRHDNDPAHKWLREYIVDSIRS